MKNLMSQLKEASGNRVTELRGPLTFTLQEKYEFIRQREQGNAIIIKRNDDHTVIRIVRLFTIGE